ncbi:MAG: U32 family peptidase [Planctomycetes bacterium]|nr:U32 family peptidase [Planctomycetota bacterium]
MKVTSGTLKPELLSPAGDFDCLRAAVENGADAVYFGLSRFSARARAHNFDPEDLPRVMQFLHARGVRGYVAFNTLLFSSELPEGEALIRAVAAAGADAVIVQDLGVARLSRAVAPSLAVHASTQMTVTSAESLEFARAAGAERAILARELTLDDIARIRKASFVPVEVFVHGALCVAYSGQCLTSEALGGRSANRGACAQACRLPYDLVVDGEAREGEDVKYLISPQDLAAYEVLPQLVGLGVCALKIEGRLKTPEYVANVTRFYRERIDAVCAGLAPEPARERVRDLELSFSRGFSTGFLGGVNHQELVRGLSPKKRGVFLGTVESAVKGRVRLLTAAPVKPGDGVVFDQGRPEEEETGGRVFEVFAGGRRTEGVDSGRVELAFARALDLSGVRGGDRVWKTDDPELTKRLRETFAGEEPRRRSAVEVEVRGRAGEPLVARMRDAEGREAEARSAVLLEPALRRPLDEGVLRAQLGRLGGTPFELGALANRLEGAVIVPLSALNAVRRELAARLEALRRGSVRHAVAPEPALPRLRAAIPREPAAPAPVELASLARTRAQAEALAEAGGRLYLDFEDPVPYADCVPRLRSRGAQIWLATPRIQKPGEELRVFGNILRARPDGVLARNPGAIDWFQKKSPGLPVAADFSLNVANELTAHALMGLGLDRLTPAYDLNFDQLCDLARAVPARWLETVVHQHMPMFHNEHCVFAARLSNGRDWTDCGRPCDTHRIALRDRMGFEHPVKADVGCRNTVFNAVAQSAGEYLDGLRRLGLFRFRVEFLEEGAAEALEIRRGYLDALEGRASGADLWRRFNAARHFGVTRGPLGF